jgi:hypothetical protein
MKQRFEVVLRELEQERQCVDEDLRRFAVAAAHLRSLLPPSRHRLPNRTGAITQKGRSPRLGDPGLLSLASVGGIGNSTE